LIEEDLEILAINLRVGECKLKQPKKRPHCGQSEPAGVL